MNRRLFFVAATAAAVLTATAGADAATYLRCGHRITTAYVSGTYVACHLSFGGKQHVDRRECAPKPTRITGGKLTVGPDGEVKGHFDLSERKGKTRAKVWGWLSFTGNLTLAFQRQGDWKIDGLVGTAKVRPTCTGSPSVFEGNDPSS